jgi:hypothetical protein
MGVLLFPEDVLNFLAGAVYDPDAERSDEGLSDSFLWADELLWEGMATYGPADPFRELVGYRRSMIRGVPDLTFRPAWEQVTRACPGWPGRRPERNCPTLAAKLDQAGRRVYLEFARQEHELQREAPFD